MRITLLGSVVALLAFGGAPAGAVTVFNTDFESGLPSELSAPGATLESVQGYAGLGAPGDQFGGNFLRYADTQVLDTDLVLTGLPPHDTLTLGFLLAVIDSWDGVELLEVWVDGAVLFSHWFQLATGDDSSYAAPLGGLLSSGTDLGFSAGSFYTHDRAYDMSLEPAFIGIPHTADSVTIRWHLAATPGGGASFWQGGSDESWAIDNVTVAVDQGTTTSTTTSSTTTTSTSASSTSTTLATTSTTIVVTTTTTTTTTLPAGAVFPSGTKLLVKQKKSGAQRLQLVVRDPAIVAATPCDVDGALVIESVGGATPPVTFELGSALWSPLKAKKPEKGCKYRKGPVVATIQLKAGKMLKVVANADDLGIPLGTDPRPVRIEVRHGDARFCVEFGGAKAQHKPDKKLLARNAAPATVCPAAGSLGE